MIFAFVLVLVIGLCVALVVGVAKDPGPPPTEIALGYEHAWDLRDFDVVYRLSGPELHVGLRKAEFIAAKRADHADPPDHDRNASEVVVEANQQGDDATVMTRLTRRDGSVVHHEVRLHRRSRTWQVVAYRLLPTPA